MKKWLPDNVTEYKDRHGKKRYRYRKAGLPTYSFKSLPGTKEFLVELRLAEDSKKPEQPPRFPPGTVDAVIVALYQTPKWRSMRPSSDKTYRSIIERFRKNNGHRQIASITTAIIDRKLSDMSDTPAAANNLRKTLSRLFRQAIKMGLINHNPVEATDAYRQQGDGFHTWTDEQIAQYEAYWPLGTRERLAQALLLYSAVRRSDMVTIGPHNREGDRLVLRHEKNSAETTIRILPQLEEALAPFEGTDGTYLKTQFGKSFTSNGFGNWFRRRVDEAGLPPECSAHGLRKAMSRILAESGVTNQEGRAVTGHKTDREFTRYAEKANKAGMADNAMANVEKRLAKQKAENNG